MFGYKIINESVLNDLHEKNEELVSKVRTHRKRSDELERMYFCAKEQISLLEKEIKRLQKLFEEKAIDEGCKIGSWCKDCVHFCVESAIGENFDCTKAGYYDTRSEIGKVYFCKKKIHEICPEWEKMNE